MMPSLGGSSAKWICLDQWHFCWWGSALNKQSCHLSFGFKILFAENLEKFDLKLDKNLIFTFATGSPMIMPMNQWPWVRNIISGRLEALDFPQTAPTSIFADNVTCIAWSKPLRALSIAACVPSTLVCMFISHMRLALLDWPSSAPQAWKQAQLQVNVVNILTKASTPIHVLHCLPLSQKPYHGSLTVSGGTGCIVCTGSHPSVALEVWWGCRICSPQSHIMVHWLSQEVQGVLCVLEAIPLSL